MTKRSRARLPRRCLSGDGGSVSVEVVGLVLPVMVIVAMLIVGAWRLSATRLDVHAAAASAARAASQQRTAAAAQSAAEEAARGDLAGRARGCTPLSVVTDLDDFGRGGSVTVTITCHVSTDDLIGVSAPGGADTTAAARAPLDTYSEVVP
ncbi:TadE/TadG family type IV pilus assembly protein [Micromonospora zamorensis]|uniref:TadE/TadG family type IV pilus assembly protein n=1 Tax=Micromonospora zamorensis TaxID=709883 RepID=UPI003D96B8C2